MTAGEEDVRLLHPFSAPPAPPVQPRPIISYQAYAPTTKAAAQPITAAQVAALAAAAAAPVAPVAKLASRRRHLQQQALSESHQAPVVEPPQEPRGRTSRRRRAGDVDFFHIRRWDDMTCWKIVPSIEVT